MAKTTDSKTPISKFCEAWNSGSGMPYTSCWATNRREVDWHRRALNSANKFLIVEFPDTGVEFEVKIIIVEVRQQQGSHAIAYKMAAMTKFHCNTFGYGQTHVGLGIEKISPVSPPKHCFRIFYKILAGVWTGIRLYIVRSRQNRCWFSRMREKNRFYHQCVRKFRHPVYSEKWIAIIILSIARRNQNDGLALRLKEGASTLKNGAVFVKNTSARAFELYKKVSGVLPLLLKSYWLTNSLNTSWSALAISG